MKFLNLNMRTWRTGKWSGSFLEFRDGDMNSFFFTPINAHHFVQLVLFHGFLPPRFLGTGKNLPWQAAWPHFRERTAFRSTEETAEVQKVPVGRLGDLKVWRTGKLDNKGTTSKNLENSIEPSLSSVLFRASISGAFRWRACFILHPVNVNLYYGPKIYLQRQKKWPLAGFCWKNNCFCFQMQIEYFHWTASLHRFGLLGRQGGKRATSNGSGEASPQGEIGASERQEGCQNEGFRFCG